MSHDPHPMTERVALMEQSIARVQSDYESEKRTRAEVNKELFAQLRELTREQQKTATIQEKILEDTTWGLKAVHKKADEAKRMAESGNTENKDKWKTLKIGALIFLLVGGKEGFDRLVPANSELLTKKEFQKTLVDFLNFYGQ